MFKYFEDTWDLPSEPKLQLTTVGRKQHVAHYEGSSKAVAVYRCNYKEAKKQFTIEQVKRRLLQP